MNNIKLSNLDNNAMLTELADEEAVAVNGGGLIKDTIKKVVGGIGKIVIREIQNSLRPPGRRYY